MQKGKVAMIDNIGTDLHIRNQYGSLLTDHSLSPFAPNDSDSITARISATWHPAYHSMAPETSRRVKYEMGNEMRQRPLLDADNVVIDLEAANSNIVCSQGSTATIHRTTKRLHWHPLRIILMTMTEQL